MAARSREKVTAAQMLGYLRIRYGGVNADGYEWAFLTEVPSATGSSYRGSADAIAMNLWPSRGLALHGFEIKCARGDWLRELKKPEKADRFIRFMDRWWIVAANDGVVLDGELPDNWGLLVLRGRRLVCKVEAPKLSSEPVSRQFLAALLRSSVVGPDAEGGIRRGAYEEGYQAGVNAGKRELGLVRRERDGLTELVKAFGETTGIHLRTWGEVGPEAKRIGEAVNVVIDGDRQVDQLAQRLRRIKDSARELSEAALRTEEALNGP